MIEKAITNFKVIIPNIHRENRLDERKIINLNPGYPIPLHNLCYYQDGDRYANWSADVTPTLNRTILARPTPQFGSISIAICNDFLTSASHTGITGETYGVKYRYVELGMVIGFHSEVFPRGALSKVPIGTYEISKFRLQWELAPTDNKRSIIPRGICRVALLADKPDGETIHAASWEMQYLRRRGILERRQRAQS